MKGIQIIQITPRRIPYAIVVVEEEATDGSLVYRAEIPDLPGCMSHGETREEAVQNLEEAMELYLETVGLRTAIPVGAVLTLTSGTGFSDQPSEVEAEITLEPTAA